MRELDLEKRVMSKLSDLDICAVGCAFSYSAGDPSGMLSITFLTSWGLDRLLDLLDYRAAADKSGFEVFSGSGTVVLTGYGLLSLFKKL